MFIHFGLYAMPARHEWIKRKESISEEHYQKYFDHFNPDLFDARDWAKRAKAAGMKYAVMTSKHHEGFCLFDSKYTEYKSTNTPCGKDLIKEYVEAFRAEGLKVGIYYSLIDWNHPHYPLDITHPRRNDANAPELDSGRDMKIYAQYIRDQVTELLTNYGKIDILWFDFSFAPSQSLPKWMQFGGGKGKDEWESERLISLVRSINPEIIINDRAQIPQDLVTPEQEASGDIPKDKETGELLTWETCQTMSGSWGYNRDESSWKTPKMLIDMLVKTVSRGGNLIMNVGPTSRGYFDSRACAALDVYRDWMRVNSRSIYGCTVAEPEFTVPEGIYLTQSEDETRLYAHILDYPYQSLIIDFPEGRVDYIQLLQDGSELQWKPQMTFNAAGDITSNKALIMLPGAVFNSIDPVIEIFLKPRD
jgi:alpha-L-fucosidase